MGSLKTPWIGWPADSSLKRKGRIMQVDRGRKMMLTVSGCLVGFVLLGGVLGRSLAVEGTYTFLKLFNEVLYLVRNNYVEPVNDDSLMQGAYRGLLENLDPMSEYLTAEEFRRASRGERNGPADIGVTLSKRKGYVVILTATEGAPAQKAGLGTGDLILTIDHKSTFRMGVWEASQALEGKQGSKVHLSVIKVMGSKGQSFNLIRQVPVHPPIAASIVEPGIGLLQLDTLEPGIGEKARKALASLQARGAKRLLLDLRNNSGPSIEEAVKTAALFTDGGKIVTIADRKAGSKELDAPSGRRAWKGPVVVLVGMGTAGPAEALAAALRDLTGAALVGDKTWGLGAVQKIIPLPAGDGIRLSVGKYLSPEGQAWNGTGLSPDVVQAAGSGTPEEDLQIRKGVEVLKFGKETRKAA
jgi:carboxyl-terminal processing protease